LPGVNGPAGTGFTDNQRPNLVAGQPCRASGGRPEQILNPAAFTLTGYQLGTNGNSPRSVCEGPDYFQVDLSLYKNIHIGNRFQMQLRFEVFNVFNRRNWISVQNVMNPTSVTLDAPLEDATQIVDFTLPGNFGQAQGVRDPRQIQLGLRFSF
jgi:hypothetical protein